VPVKPDPYTLKVLQSIMSSVLRKMTKAGGASTISKSVAQKSPKFHALVMAQIHRIAGALKAAGSTKDSALASKAGPIFRELVKKAGRMNTPPGLN